LKIFFKNIAALRFRILIFYPSWILGSKKRRNLDPGSATLLVTIFWKKNLKKSLFFLTIFSPVTYDSDEPTGLTRHLPRRLLAGHAEQQKQKRAAVGNKAVRLENDSDATVPAFLGQCQD
jgi:hypothetical protein